MRNDAFARNRVLVIAEELAVLHASAKLKQKEAPLKQVTDPRIGS
jgi:hypothetical protein